MPNIQIDRLTLRLGRGEYHAERLARLIAERLAVSEMPNANVRLGSIRLRIAAPGDGGPDATAGRIVESLLREVARSV